MLQRTAISAALASMLVAATAFSDIVTLPLAPQVDLGLNPPFGDNDARVKVEVFLGAGLLTPGLFVDTGLTSGQVILDVARDGGGNITSIQFQPGSIVSLEDLVAIVDLGVLGRVFANVSNLSFDFVESDGTTPSPSIALTDTGLLTPGGDKIYSGDAIGQGILLKTGTGVLQAEDPSQPIWGVIDAADGNTEVDVSAFARLLSSPLTLIDGITKPDSLVIDLNWIFDDIINETGFGLTTDLINTGKLVAVPEASSLVMLGSMAGLFGAGSIVRWRRRRSA